MKGLISDIQRFSLHDGPGIRTTVFFKGCPLHCAWCHNPECIDFSPSQLFYPEKCIGCNRCSEGCFAGARVPCGQEMTVQEVLAAVEQDRAYYGARGGVTFSGGEPMAQKAFLAEVAAACRAKGLHTAVETSMVYFDPEVLGQMDLIMADLKIWDAQLHKQYTGVGNEEIIENLQQANALGVPMILRTPVIPEIRQEIPKISAFAKRLKNVVQYELLPYHPLGEEKRRALGLPSAPFTLPDKNLMKELEQYAFLR